MHLPLSMRCDGRAFGCLIIRARSRAEMPRGSLSLLELLFELTQPIEKIGEGRVERVEVLETFDGAGRSAPHGLSSANRLACGNAGLRSGDGAIFESAVIGNANL